MQMMTQSGAIDESLRIDRWLWYARFFRSRSLAQTAVEHGRVLLDGERVKLSRAVRRGDLLTIRIGDDERQVRVLGTADRRGSAPQAQQLYEETQESIERRELKRERRRLIAEPAQTIEGGRPTKRDGRQLRRLRDGGG